MRGSETWKQVLGGLLARLGLACYSAPRLTIAISLALCAASLWLATAHLRLEMDWTYLFGEDDPLVQRVVKHRQAFPYPGDIAVLVDLGTPEQRRAYLEELSQRLKAEPELFHHIYFRLDFDHLRQKALYYVKVEDLRRLSQELEKARGLLGQGQVTGELSLRTLRLLTGLVEELRRSLATRGQYEHTPLVERLVESPDPALDLTRVVHGPHTVFATLAEGKLHYLLVKAGTRGQQMASQGATVTRLREIIRELAPSAYGLRVRLTGLPVLLSDERDTCTTDTTRSTLISLVAISLLLVAVFREVRRPALAVAALAVGVSWSLGYTTLAVGHLNFITVSFVAMLMGLGIDFGIHLTFRYSEELNRDSTPAEALATTLAGTGLDILVGAVATAMAFLALVSTGFQGVAELGIIASGGVMLCYLSAVTFLPALLSLFGKPLEQGSSSPTWLETSEKNFLRRSPLVALVGVLLTLVVAWKAPRVEFDYNLLNMQNQNLESIRIEKELIRELNLSVLPAITMAEDVEEARRLEGRFRQLGQVSEVTSLLAFFPSKVEEKTGYIKEIKRQAQELELPPPLPLADAGDLLALQELFGELRGGVLGEGGSSPEQRNLERHVQQLASELEDMGPGEIQDGLAAYQAALMQDLQDLLELLRIQDAEPPTAEDIPQSLRIRFIGEEGQLQMSVLPRANVWHREKLEAFLEEVVPVDPQVVGHPVVMDHIVRAVHRAQRITPWVTLSAILLVLALYLRRPDAVLLTLLPTVLSLIWIFGLMGWFGFDFNPTNFVALPITIGIGAIYGVHVLHRIQEKGDETVLTSSTGPALLLSGLTTVVGFSSLMTARHQGLSSLGFVISVGIAVNFIGSLLLLPAVARLLRGWSRVQRLKGDRPAQYSLGSVLARRWARLIGKR